MTNKLDELLADFGPYQLVIRPSGGEYKGVLWRTGGPSAATQLLTVTVTLDEAKALIERKFYDERIKQAGVPSHEDAQAYSRAFSDPWLKLTANQHRLLQVQYHDAWPNHDDYRSSCCCWVDFPQFSESLVRSCRVRAFRRGASTHR